MRDIDSPRSKCSDIEWIHLRQGCWINPGLTRQTAWELKLMTDCRISAPPRDAVYSISTCFVIALHEMVIKGNKSHCIAVSPGEERAYMCIENVCSKETRRGSNLAILLVGIKLVLHNDNWQSAVVLSFTTQQVDTQQYNAVHCIRLQYLNEIVVYVSVHSWHGGQSLGHCSTGQMATKFGWVNWRTGHGLQPITPL